MKKLIIIFIALLITLSACANNSISLEGEWVLVSYGDSQNPTSALPNVETSINFDSNSQVGGNVGCNTFSGEYKLKGTQITISEIFSTLMFCETASQQETDVFNILTSQTLNIETNSNQLILTSQDGLSVIVLEKK